MLIRSSSVMLAIYAMFALGANAASLKCNYEPAQTELTGTLSRRAYTWQPKNERVRSGVGAEQIWVLKLEEPIELKGDKQVEGNVWEGNVKEVQLVVEEHSRYKYLQDLMKDHKPVKVKGLLSHRIKGQNYTTIYMKVGDFKEAN